MDKTAPAEPRLQAVASDLLTCEITGTELSRLEDAWLPLLDAFPWAAGQAEGLKLRGRLLFGIGARLLGGEARVAEPAGELWSLIDGAQHCSDQASRLHLLTAAQRVGVDRNVPAKLRPMTIVAAVAVENVRDPASGVARGMAATLHRLTGRIPKLSLK